ncbi:hypothetical protein F5Y09DRAFT_76471 [Xylaria sp. FL1042]|nr:hypothetical protein F5Y09DRAFT_76471 [Xylaria sp. FL1042]
MYLRGEPLSKLLTATQDNLTYLKRLFDPHEHHPELGSEETCQKLRTQLQRLVHFQVHLLFSPEYSGVQYATHRVSIFNHIYARLRRTNPRLSPWKPLMPSALGGTADHDHRTTRELLTDLEKGPSAEGRIKDLLALAEECAEANARSAAAPPDMGTLRCALEDLTVGMEPTTKYDVGDELGRLLAML